MSGIPRRLPMMSNIMPAENGRRSLRRRSTIEEIEGMISTSTNTNNISARGNFSNRLPQHQEEYTDEDRYNGKLHDNNRGGQYNGGGGRRRTPTPPLEQSDYFSDDDLPQNSSPSSPYNNNNRTGSDANNNYFTSPAVYQQYLINPSKRPDFIRILKLSLAILLLGYITGTISPSQVLYLPIDLAVTIIPGMSTYVSPSSKRGRNRNRDLISSTGNIEGQLLVDNEDDESTLGPRPDFVYEHPYVSSSYYTSTKNIDTLLATNEHQVLRNLRREAEDRAGIHNNNQDPSNSKASSESQNTRTRLAIVRPFSEFDAEALPTTFTCWNALPPCKAASDDIGEADEDGYDNEEEGYGEMEIDLPKGAPIYHKTYSNSTSKKVMYDAAGDRHLFDLVGSDAMKNAKADVFLFYSQTFAENDVAIKAVDAIIDQFFEPGGWSQCFDNIYAIEANIPQELDLYIPSAQEELYNWVNGPNRQFEAAFRIIQSGEWGEYDGFYLMEGDSVPVKAHWLDVVLSEIEVNRPFAILGE